jgi:hypothetical protein
MCLAGAKENTFNRSLRIHRSIRSQRNECIDRARLAGRNISDIARQDIESPNLHSPGYPSFAVDRLQALP